MLPTPQSTTQQQFDLAYWASQPPEVQALPAITDPDQRAAQAATLATNGFTIDVPIMVWGWDAYLVMTMRAAIRVYLGAIGIAAASYQRARGHPSRRGGVQSLESAAGLDPGVDEHPELSSVFSCADTAGASRARSGGSAIARQHLSFGGGRHVS